MERNEKNIVVKNTTDKPQQIKNHGDSPFVIKKLQEAKETLRKFPVPEK